MFSYKEEVTETQFLAMADSLLRRLLAKTDRSGGENACWEWQASTTCGYGREEKTLRGYGQIGGNTPDGTRYHFLTHRLAYSLHIGRLLRPGECVLHRCDNPPCNNYLRHLFLGDRKDNADDKMAKGRHNYRTHHGSKHGMSKWTEDQVREIRALYDGKHATQTELAARYDMSQTNVSDIVRRRIWKHVK